MGGNDMGAAGQSQTRSFASGATPANPFDSPMPLVDDNNGGNSNVPSNSSITQGLDSDAIDWNAVSSILNGSGGNNLGFNYNDPNLLSNLGISADLLNAPSNDFSNALAGANANSSGSGFSLALSPHNFNYSGGGNTSASTNPTSGGSTGPALPSQTPQQLQQALT